MTSYSEGEIDLEWLVTVVSRDESSRTTQRKSGYWSNDVAARRCADLCAVIYIKAAALQLTASLNIST